MMNDYLTIENGVVIDCNTDVTDVVIPNGVTSIGDRAFAYCKSIESITIPNGVTSIGVRAFECCYSLESVTIPISVTSIGNYAFEDCGSLKAIQSLMVLHL